MARQTLCITIQQGTRQAICPLTQQYCTNVMSIKMWQLKATVFSDMGFTNVKSLHQNTCYQGYSSQNFVHIYPMSNQKEARDFLMDFANKISALAEIVSDYASLLLGKDSELTEEACYLHILKSSCEPHTQKQNECEVET